MVAVVVPIAVGGQAITLESTLLTGGKAAIFFVLVSIVGAWIFPHRPKGWFARVPLLGRLGVRHILTFDDGNHATLAILLVALVVGIVATWFGFHPAVGAYMAGLIVKEEYFTVGDEPTMFDLKKRNVYLETKHIVDNAAFSWIGPVFFVDLGAKLIFDLEVFTAVLPYAVIMTLSIMFVQIVSAALAARYTGGMSFAESVMIGFGMLGRAELAFVVMDIAYVQNPILNVEAFFTLMMTAFFLNVAVPLTISWWLPHYQRALGAVEPCP